MNKQAPFGVSYARSIPVPFAEVTYDPTNQTSTISDQELDAFAASDNTLTGTPGPDNDFDD